MSQRRTWKMWEHKGWGDSIGWLNFDQRRIHGHLTPVPRKGDLVQSVMASGRTASFRITTVDRPGDPADHFFATVEDVGYVDQEVRP